MLGLKKKKDSPVSQLIGFMMTTPILLKNKIGLKLMPLNCFEINKLVPNTNPSGIIVNYVQRHSPMYCSKDFFKIKLWFAQFDPFDQRFAFTTPFCAAVKTMFWAAGLLPSFP